VYAVPVSEPTDTESAVYRSQSHPESLIWCPKSGARTLQEIFQKNFLRLHDKEFLGRRVQGQDGKGSFEYLTWEQVHSQIKSLGTAIEKLGLAPEKAQYKDFKCRFIGIQSKNSIEWLLTDIANICYGYTTMPLYDTLGEEAVQHMFEETEMETLFLSREQLKVIAQRFNEKKTPFLKNLVIMDNKSLTEEDKKLLNGLKDVKWYGFYDLIDQHKEDLKPFPKLTPDDVAFFSYTSGTTGRPKGAIVTHKNCVAIIGGAEQTLYMLDQNTVHLSYLPLAHVFEKVVFLYLAYAGAKIAVYNGDVMKLKDDMEILHPTVFCSVPRLFNKFSDAISKKIKETGGLSGMIARRGLNVKTYAAEKYGSCTDSVYDSMVFNKTKAMLGGKVQFCLSASAPLSAKVKKVLKAAFCCPIIEGYGQTEGMGGQFVQSLNDPQLDNVGGPLPMNEFKLVDIPEMGYTHKDKDEAGNPTPRGEIWMRGPNIIPGYYKNDEKNTEAFSHGWLKSGDIGMLVPGSNALKIIDRKKNIFKLAHGEYVAPEKLEQVFRNTPGISEIYVHGNSLKSVLVGVVNLDEKPAMKLAESNGIKAANFEELCKKPEMVELLKKQLRQTADENGLKGFERIADLYIDPKPFADSDLITTTFKLKRPEAAKYYKEILDKLYENKE
jgi:long-chain acyl-CoA synthetase